jgi:Amt family ammonium transporter
MGIPDTGDTAWMLASSALVLLMTPGLAFFYGGMVRAKGVLNMLMMSISAMGVVTVLWVLYGYSLSFGNDKFDFIGDPTQYWGLKGLIAGNAKAAVAADPSTGTAADAVISAGRRSAARFRDVPADVAIITVAGSARSPTG